VKNLQTRKILQSLKKAAKNPTTWKALGLCAVVLSSSQGYCADNVSQGIESQVKAVQEVIFGKGIRMLVMLFGISWGFFKTVMSGSFQPILLYGGIGLCFFFVPKLIDLIGSIGA